MRHPSLLVSVLFLHSQSCVALPWSEDGVVNWLLARQLGGINNVIARTEPTAGWIDVISSTSTTPTTSTTPATPTNTEPTVHHGGFAPGVAHTEEPVPESVTESSSPITTFPTQGGAGPQFTAHLETPEPTTTARTVVSHPPYVEATSSASIVVPIVHTEVPISTPKDHTETPAPTAWTSPSGPQSGPPSGGHNGGSGSDSSGNAGPQSSPGGSEGHPPSTPPGYAESSSGDESPDIGAPGSQPTPAPAPMAQVSSAPPIAVTGSTGAFNLAGVPYSFSAIPGSVGFQPFSAVVVGSQTVSPGETLTINSQEVVVSASGSSLYFAPVMMVTPVPAPASVTKVWTEGGKTVTGVFAAHSGYQAGSSVQTTSSAVTVQGAKASASPEEESGAASTPLTGGSSGPTTTTEPQSSGAGSAGSSSSSEVSTNDAARAMRGNLIAAVAGLALMLPL